MFKQQSLSFHVVSKTTQNYMFSYPATTFVFPVFSAPVMHHPAYFQPRYNQSKHDFEKIIAGIILRHMPIPTWTRSY